MTQRSLPLHQPSFQSILFHLRQPAAGLWHLPLIPHHTCTLISSRCVSLELLPSLDGRRTLSLALSSRTSVVTLVSSDTNSKLHLSFSITALRSTFDLFSPRLRIGINARDCWYVFSYHLSFAHVLSNRESRHSLMRTWCCGRSSHWPTL
jgi:hypothetical protein